MDETGKTVLVDVTPTVDILQAGTQAWGEVTYSSYSTGVGGNSGTKPSFFGLSIMRKPKPTYRSLTAGEKRLNTACTIRPGRRWRWQTLHTTMARSTRWRSTRTRSEPVACLC